jgi:hypothetical protein
MEGDGSIFQQESKLAATLLCQEARINGFGIEVPFKLLTQLVHIVHYKTRLVGSRRQDIPAIRRLANHIRRSGHLQVL